MCIYDEFLSIYIYGGQSSQVFKRHSILVNEKKYAILRWKHYEQMYVQEF